MKFISALGIKTTRKPMTAKAMQRVGIYILNPCFNRLEFNLNIKARRMVANSQR